MAWRTAALRPSAPSTSCASEKDRRARGVVQATAIDATAPGRCHSRRVAPCQMASAARMRSSTRPALLAPRYYAPVRREFVFARTGGPLGPASKTEAAHARVAAHVVGRTPGRRQRAIASVMENAAAAASASATPRSPHGAPRKQLHITSIGELVGSARGARAARHSRLALVSSRRRLEPCVKFSLTRLTDTLHLAACAAPWWTRPTSGRRPKKRSWRRRQWP